MIMETCVDKSLQRKTKIYINVFYVTKMGYTMGEGDKKITANNELLIIRLIVDSRLRSR